MHQINVVISLKVLPVWKILEKIDCFLNGMSVRVGVFFLFCSFTVPFPNTTSIFFTISNTSFPVYCFRALSFSTVLSKCIFILRYLCFLGKNHRCHMYTNFLDDGKYTDAVHLRKQDMSHSSLKSALIMYSSREHHGCKRI
jgi:hypothetical protein